jgi:hypothetical protein
VDEDMNGLFKAVLALEVVMAIMFMALTVDACGTMARAFDLWD